MMGTAQHTTLKHQLSMSTLHTLHVRCYCNKTALRLAIYSLILGAQTKINMSRRNADTAGPQDCPILACSAVLDGCHIGTSCHA